MKIFLDTANLDEIRKANDIGVVDGVTTNPTLIAKEGKVIEDQIKAICEIVDGDISAEVVSTVSEEMVREGRLLSKLHKNVVVKLPLTRDGVKSCKILSGEGIRCNVTLVFSAAQALLAAKAGAYIVSPFIGRIDDLGQDGMQLIEEIATIYTNYGYKTQILAASVRTVNHVIAAAVSGAHIATMSVKTYDALFQHPLTDKGLETFMNDWSKVFQATQQSR